jgi:hypothetical protein
MPNPTEDTAAAWWQAAPLREAVRALVGSGITGLALIRLAGQPHAEIR